MPDNELNELREALRLFRRAAIRALASTEVEAHVLQLVACPDGQPRIDLGYLNSLRAKVLESRHVFEAEYADLLPPAHGLREADSEAPVKDSTARIHAAFCCTIKLKRKN